MEFDLKGKVSGLAIAVAEFLSPTSYDGQDPASLATASFSRSDPESALVDPSKDALGSDAAEMSPPKLDNLAPLKGFRKTNSKGEVVLEPPRKWREKDFEDFVAGVEHSLAHSHVEMTQLKAAYGNVIISKGSSGTGVDEADIETKISIAHTVVKSGIWAGLSDTEITCLLGLIDKSSGFNPDFQVGERAGILGLNQQQLTNLTRSKNFKNCCRTPPAKTETTLIDPNSPEGSAKMTDYPGSIARDIVAGIEIVTTASEHLPQPVRDANRSVLHDNVEVVLILAANNESASYKDYLALEKRFSAGLKGSDRLSHGQYQAFLDKNGDISPGSFESNTTRFRRIEIPKIRKSMGS